MNRLYRENKDQGLVLIGIHTEGDSEKMPAFVDQAGIEFPVCVDGGAIRTYGVDSYPDYYLIDRAGKVRVADLSNGSLDDAVAMLLAEPEPLPLPGDAACEIPFVTFSDMPTPNAPSTSRRTWALGTYPGDDFGTIYLDDALVNFLTEDDAEISNYSGTCKNDALLTLEMLMINYRDVDGFRVYDFEAKGATTEVKMRWGGLPKASAKGRDFEIPQGTVADVVLPRLITQLPFVEGEAASFPLLSFRGPEEVLRPKVTVRCAGLDLTPGAPDQPNLKDLWRYDVIEGDQVLESYWVREEDRSLAKMLLGSKAHYWIPERTIPGTEQDADPKD
ncbi:MAG: hypothetical protein ACJAZ8_000289 [Planctomycetota bacterium]|jgi:hypothetical protein